MTKPEGISARYIGLMSGTSVDAIDGVLVDLSLPKPQHLGFATLPICAALRAEILALCSPGADEINRMGQLDYRLGEMFAQVANALLDETGLAPTDIAAIGSHGQTIRHSPNTRFPFSLQIANPALIAQLTGITTVADFRARDIAAGGQGAPLVPAYHAAMFQDTQINRCIVNIGGIANLTVLPATEHLGISGFDSGPGNLLMDAWITTHLNQPFDRDGAWAASGNLEPNLLASLMSDPYFSRRPPKSTGREHFNLAWLAEKIHGALPPADVQTTLCEFTARTIAQAVTEHAPGTEEVWICGGGAYNPQLLNRLRQQLAPIRVDTTESLGVSPNRVEAMAFAWLAKQTLEGKPGNLPTVTGARTPVILGAIYPGHISI